MSASSEVRRFCAERLSLTSLREAKLGTAHYQCREKERQEYLHRQVVRKKDDACIVGILFIRQGRLSRGSREDLRTCHGELCDIVSIVDLEPLSRISRPIPVWTSDKLCIRLSCSQSSRAVSHCSYPAEMGSPTNK